MFWGLFTSASSGELTAALSQQLAVIVEGLSHVVRTGQPKPKEAAALVLHNLSVPADHKVGSFSSLSLLPFLSPCKCVVAHHSFQAPMVEMQVPAIALHILVNDTGKITDYACSMLNRSVLYDTRVVLIQHVETTACVLTLSVL